MSILLHRVTHGATHCSIEEARKVAKVKQKLLKRDILPVLHYIFKMCLPTGMCATYSASIFSSHVELQHFILYVHIGWLMY